MINTIVFGFLTTAQAGEIAVSAKGHANNPVWSADGAKIAFEVNAQAGDISIFVADVVNGNSSAAPQKVSLNVGGSSFGGSSGVVTAAPVWHPKGMLFFEGSHKGGSNRVYVHSFTGAPPRQAVSEAQVSGDLSWPSVSKDGTQLVFVSDSTGKGDVYTFSLLNWKDSKAITSSEHSEMAPRFHEDGRIIYT
jgi:Tol biopolymer transport system component